MLTDDQANGMEQALREERDIHAPLLRRWLSEVLADRKDRIAQVRYLRQRLEQAFRYLTGLCEPKRQERQESERQAKERSRRERNS